MFSKLIITIAVLTAPIWCSPDGAPEKSCKTMIPAHGGIDSQRTQAPYSIDVKKIEGKLSYNVVIKGYAKENKIKGYLLQARMGDRIIGNFTLSGDETVKSHAISCGGNRNVYKYFFVKRELFDHFLNLQNALTHSVPVFKDAVSGTWNAPDNLLNKRVFMR